MISSRSENHAADIDADLEFLYEICNQSIGKKLEIIDETKHDEFLDDILVPFFTKFLPQQNLTSASNTNSNEALFALSNPLVPHLNFKNVTENNTEYSVIRNESSSSQTNPIEDTPTTPNVVTTTIDYWNNARTPNVLSGSQTLSLSENPFFPNSPQNSRNTITDNRINRYCLVTPVVPVNIPSASNTSNEQSLTDNIEVISDNNPSLEGEDFVQNL